MMEGLLALVIFLNNPTEWKQEIYEQKYNQVIEKEYQKRQITPSNIGQSSVRSGSESQLYGAISWYAKGLKNPELYTTACWGEFPKGTKFRVSYGGNNVVVVCNDRGAFREMGRVLDLSSGAFKQLAPLKQGIIRGAIIEVVNE